MSSNKILIGVVSLALALSACGGHKTEKKAEAQTQSFTVRAIDVKPSTVPEFYEATGTVKARVSTVLSARVMGYLRDVRVQAGDAVRAGQVIAVIEAREIDDAVAQAQAGVAEARSAMPEVDNAIAAAKAQLDLAESTFKRMQSLYEQKSITSQEFDEVQAKQRMAAANHQMALAKRTQLASRIKQAESALAQASVTRSYTEIKSPFAGIVVERKAEPGMLAAPGMPVAVVEQASGYRLEVSVEESRIGSIKAGMKTEVKLDALDKELEARVSEIVPALDPVSRTFTTRIDLPAGSLIRSGLFGRARFAAGAKEALTVPESSVRRQGQVESVFVASGGQARSRLVKLGNRTSLGVEVLSGLTAGDKVVADPPAGLRDGARIEVRP